MSQVKEIPVLAVSRRACGASCTTRMLGQLNLSQVESVGLDETASRRGQRYVTVFLDLQRQQEPVIFAFPGHRKAAIAAFSAFLAEHGGDLDHVVEMVYDMSHAFLSWVAEHQ